MNVHEIIDEFVTRVDPSGDIFRKVESAPWIEDLEDKLAKRFPASFRSLLTRYAFQSFGASGLSFFSNTGTAAEKELSVAIFKDKVIAETTLKSGYIQFARPESGSYDPVCFDVRHARSNREFPLVRLDHEEILCRDRILVSETLCDSFYRFVADFVVSERGDW